MRRFGQLGIAVLALMSFATAQKPRVFVQGKGSQDVNTTGESGGGQHWGVFGSKSTIDSHDESMEITKDLQKHCDGVIITLNQTNADYTVLLNRESKKNRGLLRSNSQIEVANKGGDILGTNATHTVGNAAKDACELIVEDWAAHGSAATTGASAGSVASSLSQAPQVTPAVSPSGAVAATAPISQMPDAETPAKQHQACLQLAKDNPSIICK